MRSRTLAEWLVPAFFDSVTMSNQTVAVFGAYGHTGRFVVSELVRRGWTPIASGRDASKLNALGAAYPGRTFDLRR